MLLLLLLACGAYAAGPTDTAALNLYKTPFKGDGTYYGDSGGGGTCSYGRQNPAAASSVRYPVALNKPQFLNSLMCGSCWEVTGTGQGSGATPIRGAFVVFVDNLCPECHPGDLDFGVSGDGRWSIFIQAAQCSVGNTNIDFKFQGSNPFYIKLQVRNARLPVHLLEIDHNGWQHTTRSPDNFFLYTSGPIQGSFRVRLTAINGEQIIDTISGIQNDVIIKGNHQFSFDRTLPGHP